MKSYFSLLIILLSFFNGYSQQLGLSNLYGTNLQSINPAFSSISDYDAVFLNHRSQWSEVDNSPVTSFISGNYSINKSNGIGANVYLENIGLIRQLYALSSYSHSIRIKNHEFSLGLGLGIHQQSISLNEIIAEDYTDDILTNNTNSGFTLLTELGGMYNFKNITLGFSSPRIFETKIKSTSFGLERQQIGFASYNIKYNDKIDVIPSALYKFVTLENSQYDFNLDLDLNRQFLIGAGYRSNNSILLRANAHLKDRIDIGYSFESNYNNSLGKFISHEIRLAYKIFHPKEELDLEKLVLDSNIVIRNDSAFLIYKDENDSIIRFRFINIESLREYTIKHKDKDYTIDYLVNQKLEDNPELKTLNLLLEQDSLYTVEIEDSLGKVKKHRFVTLKELHDFNYKLSRENPILSAKLKKEVDIHPDTNIFHIINPNFDSYEIDIYDSITLETKKFKFKNIEALNDFILNAEKNDKSLYRKIMNKIYDEPELNLFTVNVIDEEIEIVVNNKSTNKTEKFKFKNVKELNDFILNLEKTNPELALEIKNQVDLNPNIRFIEVDKDNENNELEVVVIKNNEIERFKFKNVKELNDFILKLNKTNPELASKIKNQFDVNPDIRFVEIDNSTSEPKTDKSLIELKNLCSKIDITFDINKSKSDFSAYDNTLNEISTKLNNSNYRLIIIGHTCDLGTDAVNQRVALNRAQTMKDLLIKKGASSNKIKIKSMGSKKPLVPNTSEENRKVNRRVEFVIE